MLDLTLRTLLAYIDDTLDPIEARSLGKRVAASDETKLLVERIKQVTRRRRLATPDVTDHDETADPNTVAAYLDNALDPATVVPEEIARLPRPILLNVGRVAPEKNIGAFLELDVPGTKVVVGGGPALDKLKAAYPDVLFLGSKQGLELASTYCAADVFVFPSRTDTFGLVNIEALACGLPVAAFPVAGPIDILGSDGRGVHGGAKPIGALDEDLGEAVRRALHADRAAAAEEARLYSWARCTERFFGGLAVDSHGRPLSRRRRFRLVRNGAPVAKERGEAIEARRPRRYFRRRAARR